MCNFPVGMKKLDRSTAIRSRYLATSGLQPKG